MIIDTNGFEIYDTVYAVHIYKTPRMVVSGRINNFVILKQETLVRITNDCLNEEYPISCVFHTEQECQLACDKLNSKI